MNNRFKPSNKEVAQKPIFTIWKEEFYYLCPECEEFITKAFKENRNPLWIFDYCPCCGQKLDWGEKDE